MPKQLTVEEELAMLTKDITNMTKGNGPTEPVLRTGVAEELAQFIEKHAMDMMREAQEHQETSQKFADEIRKLTDEQLAVLKNFTDSIKASKDGMSEVRTKFLQSRTSNAMDQPTAPLDVSILSASKT